MGRAERNKKTDVLRGERHQGSATDDLALRFRRRIGRDMRKSRWNDQSGGQGKRLRMLNPASVRLEDLSPASSISQVTQGQTLKSVAVTDLMCPLDASLAAGME